MAVTADALARQARLDAEVGHVIDEQTRALVAAWIDAWDAVRGELDASISEILSDYATGEIVSKARIARSNRLLAALDYIRLHLETLSRNGTVRILADLRPVIMDAIDAQRDLVAYQLPPAYPLIGTVPGYTVDAIVARSAQQITSLSIPLAPRAYALLRQELVNGVVIGANPRTTAAKIVRRAEMRFNGGLSRAVNIARTETIDAHRVAAAAGQAAHADVLGGWVWLAHLSPRTCPSCIAMNGTLHALEEPGPLDHQQGRCARMPKALPWSSLGIDLEEPRDLVPRADTWFESLPAPQQRSILGDAGYDAWRRGDFPLEKWAQRRQTRGWRDSYVPAKPPAAGRAA